MRNFSLDYIYDVNPDDVKQIIFKSRGSKRADSLDIKVFPEINNIKEWL
jgi:hypothetical protein